MTTLAHPEPFMWEVDATGRKHHPHVLMMACRWGGCVPSDPVRMADALRQSREAGTLVEPEGVPRAWWEGGSS